MTKVVRSSIVNAPAWKVFSSVDDPIKMKDFIPGVEGVSDVVRSPGRVGDTFTVEYRVMGMHFRELFEYTVYIKDRRIWAKFTGPMNGTMGISLQPSGVDATQVTVAADYDLQGGVFVASMKEKLLRWMTGRDFEKMLEKLKLINEPV